MEFIRENILKIIIFIAALIIAIVVFSLIFGGKKITKITTYNEMENQMVASAKKYVNDNKKLNPTKDNEISKINLDTLVNAKYIDNMTAIEDNNVTCTGYVEIMYNQKSNIYVPYLKCGKYYETQTLAGYITNNQEIVTTGDGLYKQGDTYVFKGEKPNNYVAIGQRLYRIIDINDNEVRLISNKKLTYYLIWDNRYNTDKTRNVGINDYSKSRIKDYLESMYKNNTFSDNNTLIFSEQEYEKMVAHDICIAKRSSKDGAIDRNADCQQVEPNQYLGLLSVSDYANASLDTNCKTIFDKSCMNYNYFSNIGSSFRTTTAITDNTYQIFSINEGKAEIVNASNSFNLNLIIYIDALSLYNGGDGSFENPYTIR